MKKIILIAVLLPALLLMGAAAREPEPVAESAVYRPPAPAETPEPEPEPVEPKEAPEGFTWSLDEPAEITHIERPWTYDDNLSRVENIKSYLMEEAGLSLAATCGVIASIDVETGGTFDPNASNPVSYGLCQWLGGRLDKLEAWEDYTEIPGQLDFLVWELQCDDPYGTWDELTSVENTAEGARRAGWYFCYWFERPYDLNNQARYRGYLATEYFNDWSNE